MRVAVVMRGLQPNLFQQVADQGTAFFLVLFNTMYQYRLGDGFPNGNARVEGRVGVLEYNLSLLAEVAQGLALQCSHLNVVEPYLAVCGFNQS